MASSGNGGVSQPISSKVGNADQNIMRQGHTAQRGQGTNPDIQGPGGKSDPSRDLKVK